ncbi:MAG: tyrosine--tRNA ligase [Fibrobacteria bacterium]|nr:tyrosine--tRNA ligase [Fibrobacteria bacterium]
MEIQTQLEILKRGAIDIISEEELLQKLKLQRPLNVKLGVDPTSPDIHLGFTVVMRKLKQFQELGHQVILIVGDYTATVGDPSGKNKTRPMLSHEQVIENAETYQQQFFKIVDKTKTKVVYNGEWFKPLSFDKVTNLLSQITVAQMLEREDFQNRYRSGQSISLHEFLYPMMQGYDSVMIEADVELGGTDQKFNILRGRELQKNAGQAPQIGLMLPILIGTDGKEKMSKSLGNTIGINESAQSMYHKIYNLPDDLITDYLTLLTNIPLEEIKEKASQVTSGQLNPNHLKQELATDIVSQYHGKDKANEASQAERKIHIGAVIPDDIPECTIAKGEHWVPSLLASAGLVQSNSEGRRLILNGGVSFDEEKILDPKANVTISQKHILKAGKRKFVRILATP